MIVKRPFLPSPLSPSFPLSLSDHSQPDASSQIPTPFFLLLAGSIIFSASMVALALAAPLLEYLRNPFAGSIYSYFSLSCHQIPSRSFWILGSNMGICSRCFSIYLSYSLTFIIFLTARNSFHRLFAFNSHVYCILSLLFVAPLLIDGGLATFTSYISTNALRSATGVMGGAGLACLGYLLYQNMHRRVETC